MNFIKPRNIKAEKVDWRISEQSRAIVKYYAEYTEHTESDVVDTLLKNIIDDKDFIKWIQERRFNKRILSQLFVQGLIDSGTETDE